MLKDDIFKSLQRYGKIGVDALIEYTPRDSGLTAESWGYEIQKVRGSYSLIWTNDNLNDGVNIALLIQYGHGTEAGAYIQGYNYINPAIRPIFDRIAEEIWKEVTRA
jgi:hypothetical protein